MRKLVRKLTALSLLACVAFSLSGCGSTVSSNSGDHTGRWWRNHMKQYLGVLRKDARNFYQTFDRHFVDLDWNDPMID